MNEHAAKSAVAILIARLARRDNVVRGQTDAMTAALTLVDLATGAETPVAGLHPAFREAVAAGHLDEVPGGGGVWRLSKSGRALARRHRTERTVAMAATPAARERTARAASARQRPRSTTAAARPSGPGYNDAESPLGWLARRRDRNGRPILEPHQFDAGERLRADLFFAGLTPRVTASWSGIPEDRGARGAPGTGMEMADRIVAARQRVSRALEAVGPELSGILIDVCGHLKGLEEVERSEGWPQRSAKLLLQAALTTLARHYGLLPIEPATQAIGRRLRHWGAEDYRPTLERRREA